MRPPPSSREALTHMSRGLTWRDKDKTVIGLEWGDDPLEDEKRPHINTANDTMGWFTGSQYVAPQKMAGFWSALRSLGESMGHTLHPLEVACLIHLSRSASVLRIYCVHQGSALLVKSMLCTVSNYVRLDM